MCPMFDGESPRNLKRVSGFGDVLRVSAPSPSFHTDVRRRDPQTLLMVQ